MTHSSEEERLALGMSGFVTLGAHGAHPACHGLGRVREFLTGGRLGSELPAGSPRPSPSPWLSVSVSRYPNIWVQCRALLPTPKTA